VERLSVRTFDLEPARLKASRPTGPVQYAIAVDISSIAAAGDDLDAGMNRWLLVVTVVLAGVAILVVVVVTAVAVA